MFRDWKIVGGFEKLGNGFSAITFYRKGYASEQDPTEKSKWLAAINSVQAAAMAAPNTGASTALGILGLATGNPALLAASATTMNTAQLTAAGSTTGTAAGSSNPIGSLQTYTDSRVKIGLTAVAGIAIIVLIVWIVRRKK